MKKGEISKNILLAVAATSAVGGFVVTLADIPGVGAAIRPFTHWYRGQDKYGRYRIRKTFSQLRRDKLIEMSQTPEGKMKVILTETGRKKVLEYKMNDLKIATPKKWDKKWRIVMFDIPEEFKKSRYLLRAKLQRLNFQKLQNSVWVYPHECRPEIKFIAEVLNISPYIRLAEVNRFDGDNDIKTKLNL